MATWNREVVVNSLDGDICYLFSLLQDLALGGIVHPCSCVLKEDIISMVEKGYNRVFLAAKNAGDVEVMVEELKQAQPDLRLDIRGVETVSDYCTLEAALLA